MGYILETNCIFKHKPSRMATRGYVDVVQNWGAGGRLQYCNMKVVVMTACWVYVPCHVIQGFNCPLSLCRIGCMAGTYMLNMLQL